MTDLKPEGEKTTVRALPDQAKGEPARGNATGGDGAADQATTSEVLDGSPAGFPASIVKLLSLARRQSKQLEEVANATLSGTPNKGPPIPVDVVAPEPERRTTIGRKSLKDRVPLINPADVLRPSQIRKASEIQPEPEPAESSNRRPSAPQAVENSPEEQSSEQLTEFQARALTPSPAPSLRQDSPYEAYAKENFKTHHAFYRSSFVLEDLIKFSQVRFVRQIGTQQFLPRHGPFVRTSCFARELASLKIAVYIWKGYCGVFYPLLGERLRREYGVKTRILEPLLRNVHHRDRHDAVAVFAHLMAYMGDLTRSKSERAHLLQILSGGLRRPTLRDEIYCQICKQTTNNPDSVSNVRGWQVMALSCGLFPPSESFRPVLEAHLEQVVQGQISTTDAKSGEAVLDPSNFAFYSLVRLRKLLRVGQRHLLPLPEEVAAVERLGKISATVFLPDSTNKSMPFDPMVTTEEVVLEIVQLLGLSEPKYFWLWEVDPDQVERSLGKKEYVAEVQSKWASTCIPQSINDFESPLRGCMKCWRRARKSVATVTDLGDAVLDQLFLMDSDGDFLPKLLFKRNLYVSSEDVDITANIKNRELALDYSQAVHDVLRGAYPLADNDLMMLAALQLRAEFGTKLPTSATGLEMTKYLPQKLEERADNVKVQVVDIANGLPMDPSPAMRRIDYLDYLKTRYPLAEASWFAVKQTDNDDIPEALWVAINGSGVYFLQIDSLIEIMHMKYTEICSWAYSQTSFSIVSGNMTYNDDHRLITLQGKDMSEVMQIYVNRIF